LHSLALFKKKKSDHIHSIVQFNFIIEKPWILQNLNEDFNLKSTERGGMYPSSLVTLKFSEMLGSRTLDLHFHSELGHNSHVACLYPERLSTEQKLLSLL
jgi:hypothetical protein